jgi:hypothetical protein
LTRCANKNDALSIIKVLKNKYKLSGTIWYQLKMLLKD